MHDFLVFLLSMFSSFRASKDILFQILESRYAQEWLKGLSFSAVKVWRKFAISLLPNKSLTFKNAVVWPSLLQITDAVLWMMGSLALGDNWKNQTSTRKRHPVRKEQSIGFTFSDTLRLRLALLGAFSFKAGIDKTPFSLERFWKPGFCQHRLFGRWGSGDQDRALLLHAGPPPCTSKDDSLYRCRTINEIGHEWTTKTSGFCISWICFYPCVALLMGRGRYLSASSIFSRI